MSERLASDATPTTFNQQRDLWYSGIETLDPRAHFDPDILIEACSQFSGVPGPHYNMFLGWLPAAAGPSNTSYNHAMTPSSKITDCAAKYHIVDPIPQRPQRFSLSSALISARSNHSGGSVNILLLDGAVKRHSASIDLTAWRKLGTYNDSEFR